IKVQSLVEQGAGIRAYASDDEYRKAGAEVVSRNEIYEKAEVVLTIHTPESEYEKLKSEQVLISVINPLMNTTQVSQLTAMGKTVFSLDIIPRSTRAQAMDILSSMATISGYKAVLDAAGLLPHFFPMFMTAAGTIKPAKVLILGAGVAGLQAIATSRKLGAVVEVFDVRSAVRDEVKSLGGKFIEVEGAREDAAAGGYAVEQTEDFKQKQRQLIHDHAVKSDIIICTAQIPGKKAPVLLQKETVENMRAGSVVIDLAASTGGNCEVTQDGKTIIHNGVKVVGKSDYPSDLPSDASKMFGKNVINFAKLLITKEGALNVDFNDDIVKGTCVCHAGEIMSDRIKSIIQNK
ncbi:MAG: NAD(P) transhydrogenase subunit alpha, partial [Bacteroidota bacterium]|nr:NAD(P) transhydrogenase subunit alpha [Bacteroidota bacterium]